MTIYFWVDLETTGLDVNTCQIIEAAAIVTTEKFEPIDTYQAIVNPSCHLKYEKTAHGFHKHSGLADIVHTGKPTLQVENELLNLLKKYEPRKRRAYLAGNNVYFDRKFLEKHMPSIPMHLTNTHLDVSTIRLLTISYFGKEEASFKAPRPHRALDDLHRSIKELHFYVNDFIFPKIN